MYVLSWWIWNKNAIFWGLHSGPESLHFFDNFSKAMILNISYFVPKVRGDKDKMKLFVPVSALNCALKPRRLTLNLDIISKPVQPRQCKETKTTRIYQSILSFHSARIWWSTWDFFCRDFLRCRASWDASCCWPSSQFLHGFQLPRENIFDI